MTRARPKFNATPRGLIDYESAGDIWLGPTDFSRVLTQLEAEGS